jgi:hypothetical protein
MLEIRNKRIEAIANSKQVLPLELGGSTAPTYLHAAPTYFLRRLYFLTSLYFYRPNCLKGPKHEIFGFGFFT